MSLKRKADHLDDDSTEHEFQSPILPLKRPRRCTPSASPPEQPHQTPTQFLNLPRRDDSSPDSVPFQKPSLITTFSYTPDRQLAFDNSAIKYLVQPPLRADLAYRYSDWAKRPDEKGRLDSLLRAVARTGVTQSPFQGAVCWRGVMCKMIVAPYEDRDGWSINVMRVNGVLYFEEHLTDAQLEAKNDLEPHHRQSTYYGYSFESWCTSSEKPSPNRRPTWGGDVNTAVQWCAVVKTKLGPTRLVLGGEVDCVRGAFTGQTDNFVELKTSLAIRPRNAGDKRKFEKKLLKFYFQSFLLGVPELLVGFRTPHGHLAHTQSMRTLALPRLVRGGAPGDVAPWDPHVCLRWGAHLLARVATWMADPISASSAPSQTAPSPSTPSPSPSPSAVARIVFTPGTGVAFFPLDEAQVRDVVAGEDRVGFLPTWYYTECMNQAQAQAPP